MQSPPFHRRILPWIFAIIFLVSAPALIFYTSGYRWNAKKGKIERNGTLIIDSIPSKASVFLNGKNSNEITPITLQNVTPGNYTIRIQKNSYHSWEKRLDVYPELVTFVNEIRLWKDTEPVEDEFTGNFRLDAAPNGKILALLQIGTASSVLTIWMPESEALQNITIPSTLTSNSVFSWSPDSRYLFLFDDDDSGQGSRWLINLKVGAKPISLQKGVYRWNGNLLEGSTNEGKKTIDPYNGAITRQPYPNGVIDIFGALTIKHATGTDNLVLFDDDKPEKGFILPSGNWRIHDFDKSGIILRDDNSWLKLDAEKPVPEIYQFTADWLRPIEYKNVISYLGINGGELWVWHEIGETELLLRESNNIGEAVWHSDGRDIAFALNGGVFMLNLDNRNGRIRTRLAQFDNVYDIALVRKKLFIAAELNGRNGLWELEIE